MAAICLPQSFPSLFGPSGPFHSDSLHNSYPENPYDNSNPRKTPVMHSKIGARGSLGGLFGSATQTVILPKDRTAAFTTYQESAPDDLARNFPAIRGSRRGERLTDSPELEDVKSEGDLNPRYALEVESLAQRLQENVVVKDMPIKAPQWIHVPKGYLMDLEKQPAKFYRERGAIRTEVKKRKREGGLTKSAAQDLRDARVVQGFRPEDVNSNGAVCLAECPPSTLSNDIHPIFDRSSFDDTPDAIYDQLVPGLQLATHFLTQPVCMQFWVTLAMGHRSNDPEMSAINGKLSQRIARHVELTEERAKTVLQHIDDVGKSKLIHFRFKRGLSTLDAVGKDGAFGVSLPICDYKGIDTEYHGIDRSHVRSLIRIHSDYYTAAKKLSQLKYQEQSQKLRFNFGFAVLIVHEVAHSIEGIHFRKRAHQWVDWHTSKWYKEPYWLDWQESECGRAWEATMFGGHIQPINAKIDGSHGIGVADWPFGGPDEDSRKYRWWTISMNYIVHMFQNTTWQQSIDLKDWRIFHIPRDGATSLFINSFSTMAQSEEERVAKEEAAELVAQLEEEPAKKKRIKGTGSAEDRRPSEVDILTRSEVEKPLMAKPKVVRTTSGSSKLHESSTSQAISNGNKTSYQPQRKKLVPHTQKRQATGTPIFGSDPQRREKRRTRPKPLVRESRRQRQLTAYHKLLRRNLSPTHLVSEMTGKMLAAMHTASTKPSYRGASGKMKNRSRGILNQHKAQRRGRKAVLQQTVIGDHISVENRDELKPTKHSPQVESRDHESLDISGVSVTKTEQTRTEIEDDISTEVPFKEEEPGPTRTIDSSDAKVEDEVDLDMEKPVASPEKGQEHSPEMLISDSESEHEKDMDMENVDAVSESGKEQDIDENSRLGEIESES